MRGINSLGQLSQRAAELPSGVHLKGQTRARISQIIPTLGTFTYLGCGKQVRGGGNRLCKRSIAPARRLDMDGRATQPRHDGACDSKRVATWYWRFCVTVSDDLHSLEAAVWDVGDDLLHDGVTPASASAFSTHTRSEQFRILEEKMHTLSTRTMVVDLLYRQSNDANEDPFWVVVGISRPVMGPLPTPLQPLQETRPTSSSVLPDWEDVPQYCSSPEHDIRYFPDPASIRDSGGTMQQKESVVILSSDSEYASPEFTPVFSDSPSPQSRTEEEIHILGTALEGLDIEEGAKSDEDASDRSSIIHASETDSVDHGNDTNIRGMFLAHLDNDILRAELDLAQKKEDVRKARDYLEELRGEYIQLDSM